MLVVSLLAIVLAQLALMAYFMRATSRERADLLQRIQAPQLAVIEHATQKMPATPPMPVEWDNDEAYHENREQLAVRLANFDRELP